MPTPCMPLARMAGPYPFQNPERGSGPGQERPADEHGPTEGRGGGSRDGPPGRAGPREPAGGRGRGAEPGTGPIFSAHPASKRSKIKKAAFHSEFHRARNSSLRTCTRRAERHGKCNKRPQAKLTNSACPSGKGRPCSEGERRTYERGTWPLLGMSCGGGAVMTASRIPRGTLSRSRRTRDQTRPPLHRAAC